MMNLPCLVFTFKPSMSGRKASHSDLSHLPFNLTSFGFIFRGLIEIEIDQTGRAS
jgi:hypothetical protein